MIKWPWVSRDTYDRHTQVLIDAQGGLIDQNAWLRERYEALVERVLTMKQEGFTAAPDYSGYIEPALSTDEADALKVELEEYDG